jgi:putative membrane protein
MKKSLLLSAALASLICTPAFAQDKASQKFLTEAIQGNFAEVAMGQLAQQNGQREDVKAYGQMLVTDHGAANQKAMDAAKSLNVTPPTGPSAKQKATMAKMEKQKGAAFDKAFARDMVMDHKKDIAAYDKESKKTDAAGQYAKDTLPTLHKHLDAAQALEKNKSAAR